MKQDIIGFCEYFATGEGVTSQNSIAFRFGQAYDKRNLPKISVYQYERHQVVRYPWDLKISNEAGKEPVIIHTEFKSVA
ncbi:SAVED domain-containing protein [Shewanella sp. WE21]|uniref:SAVED domain-containing protein n=1 Tax=Shewanella sp. WE21 TaxID=2029986 RepID=UPI00131A3F7C|nr:SAVED domain-containing protein [Shewanella sp. WE21]